MDVKERQTLDVSRSPMMIPTDLPSNAKLPIKIDTVLWIILSIITLYYSDLINVIKADPLIEGTAFTLAICFGGLSLAVGLYLIIWCSYIRGISTDDWESHNPFAIPLATGSAVISGICWNISLWHVYGIKTPLLILVLSMGFVMIVSILPTGSSVERNNPRQPLSNSKWMKAHGKVE